MNNHLRQFLKASCFWGVVFVAVAAGTTHMSGCSGEPDPGVCSTNAEFLVSTVNRDYVEMVCGDWVSMLTASCISIDGLEAAPSDRDIGAFCGRAIREGGDYFTFVIPHSCNFIDNPNFVCTQYGSAQQPLVDAAFDGGLKSRFGAPIASSPRLKAEAGKVRMHLPGGVTLNLDTFDLN